MHFIRLRQWRDRRPLVPCQVAEASVSKLAFYYDPADFDLKKGWFPFRNNHFFVNSEKVNPHVFIWTALVCRILVRGRPLFGLMWRAVCANS